MAGIYIHIPFCRQACTYCNFHFSTSLRLKDEVLQAILVELDLQRDFLRGAPIDTIYFGGGTPSLLDAGEINRITDYIFQHYPIGELKEVTLEANPDDLTPQYLRDLRTTPVNRFSIGVQSFFDADLQYMNRAHNASQADYAIKAAQDAGFTNITIDLIYGTPGLTDAQWRHNLSQVSALQLPHFSAYALTVEEGTALHHNISRKKAAPVDAAQAAVQMELLMEQAEAMGYEHYEISNLARDGQYAVHNTNYWRGLPYLGIGPAAHSFIGHERRWNVANNALYAQSLLQHRELNYEAETLTPTQQLNEYLMTSLRTTWGTDLQHIAQHWGDDHAKEILESSHEHQEKGLLQQKEDILLLTHKGKLFADGVAGDLFVG